MNGATLLMNIYEAPQDILSSREIISLFLIRCVEKIDMTPVLNTLQVVQFPIPVKSKTFGEFGISAGLILIESHIYIHTWTEKRYARLEISSCKKFTSEKVIDCVRTFFGKDAILNYKVIDWDEYNLGKDLIKTI